MADSIRDLAAKPHIAYQATEKWAALVARTPQPYWNPYHAGIGIGLVLLLAFVIMGRGLGASGAFSSIVAAGIESVNPQHAKANSFYGEYLGDGTRGPLKDWLVFEIIGVVIGGFVAAEWIEKRREPGHSPT